MISLRCSALVNAFYDLYSKSLIRSACPTSRFGRVVFQKWLCHGELRFFRCNLWQKWILWLQTACPSFSFACFPFLTTPKNSHARIDLFGTEDTEMELPLCYNFRFRRLPMSLDSSCALFNGLRSQLYPTERLCACVQCIEQEIRLRLDTVLLSACVQFFATSCSNQLSVTTSFMYRNAQ